MIRRGAGLNRNGNLLRWSCSIACFALAIHAIAVGQSGPPANSQLCAPVWLFDHHADYTIAPDGPCEPDGGGGGGGGPVIGGCDSPVTPCGGNPGGCLTPGVVVGDAYQDSVHLSKWRLSDTTLIPVTRVVPHLGQFVPEGGIALLMTGPEIPAAIQAFDGEKFELTGQTPPGEATLRDFFGVTLSSGQVDIALPTGIEIKQPSGDDFALKVNIRSVVQRRGILGPFASLNYEDFLVIEKMETASDPHICSSDLTPQAWDIKGVVNSAPSILRIKGGAPQIWTNAGVPATPPGSNMSGSPWFSNAPANSVGVPFANSTACQFLSFAGGSPAPFSIGQNAQYAKSVGAHLSMSSAIDLRNALGPAGDAFHVFLPPAGTLEALSWSCYGVQIIDADGTKTVYSMFSEKKETDVCIQASNLPHTNGTYAYADTLSLHPDGQKASLSRYVAPAMYRETRDGLRTWYLYNAYGQLAGWRDSLGREVAIIYDNLGDGSAGFEATANRVKAIKAFDGRECQFLYDSAGMLASIALPDLDTGAPGQAHHDRVIGLDLDKFDLPITDGQLLAKFEGAPEKFVLEKIKIATPNDEAGSWTFVADFDRSGTAPFTDNRVVSVDYKSNTIPAWLSGGSTYAGGTTTYQYLDWDWKTPCAPNGKYTVIESLEIRTGEQSVVEHDFDLYGNEIEQRAKVQRSKGGSIETAVTKYEYDGPCKYLNLKTAEIRPDGTVTRWKYRVQVGSGLSQYWNGCGSNDFQDTNDDFFSQHNVLTESLCKSVSSPESEWIVKEFTYGRWRQVKSEYFPRPGSVAASDELKKFEHTFDYELTNYPKPKRAAVVATWQNTNAGQYTDTTTTFEYNDYAQMLRSEDSLGRVASNTYHVANDPDGDGVGDWALASTSLIGQLPGYLKEEIVDPPGGSSSGLNLTTTHRYDRRGFENLTIDPKGNKVAVGYNEMNQAFVISKGSFASHANGEASESPVGAGFSKEYRYFDANGNVTEVRHWNDNPDTSSLTTNSGYVTTKYIYDGLDRLVEVQNELVAPGSALRWLSTRWVRDAMGRIVREVRPDGSTTSVMLAPQGAVLENRIHAARSSTTGPIGSPPVTNDAQDVFKKLTYDLTGKFLEGEDALGAKEILSYDDYGRPISRKDPAGTVLKHELNTLGQPTREDLFSAGANPIALKTTIFDYDKRYRLKTKRDKWFEVVGTTSTPIGDGEVTTTYDYDSEDQNTTIIDDAGNDWAIEYDNAGRKIKDTYPPHLTGSSVKNVDEYVLDELGNVKTLKITEWGIPDGATSPQSSLYTLDHEFDALNREKRTVRAKGTSLESAIESIYDSLGQVRRTKEPKNSQVVGTHRVFDTLGRNVKIIEGYNDTFTGPATGLATVSANADGFVTLIKTYDDVGNITEEKDDRGNGTSYEFDAFQRRTKITYADGSSESVAYRQDGLADSLSLFGTNSILQNVIDYDYDGAKRKTYEHATFSPDVFSGLYHKTWLYDDLGRPTYSTAINRDPLNQNRDLLCVTERRYDSLGRVLEDKQRAQERTSVNAPWVEFSSVTVQTTYDSRGNVTRTWANQGSGAGTGGPELDIERTYDSLSQLRTVTDVSGARNDLLAQYDWRGARGRVETIRHPWNGTKTIFTDRDARGRVGQIRTENAGGVIGGRKYAYGPSSVKLHEVKLGSSSFNALDDHVYEHDALDRLTVMRQGDYDPSTSTFASVPTVKEERLDFDGVGNVLSHTVPGVTTPYVHTVDTLNHYQNNFDGQYVARDYRGNTIDLGVMSLTYDAYGHVAGTVRPFVTPIVPTIEVRDAFDRRVYREVSGQRRVFVHQGEELLEEVAINVSSNPVQYTLVADREYFHGAGIDEVVAQRVRSVVSGITSYTTYAMHVDSMGTPYAATAPNGALSEEYDIDPFGKYAESDVDGGGTIGNRISLAGMWHDNAITNLIYMRARHYSPVLKRFVSRDPIGVWGDVLGDGNGYAYGGASPSRYADPLGLYGIDVAEESFEKAVDVISGTSRDELKKLEAQHAKQLSRLKNINERIEKASSDGERESQMQRRDELLNRMAKTSAEVSSINWARVEAGEIVLGVAEGIVAIDEAIDRVNLLRGMVKKGLKLAIKEGAETAIEKWGAKSGATVAAKGAGEASSLANAARLRGQLAGREIAGGHAFEKHVLDRGEFKGLGIRTREQFANHIENVVNNPTASRQLSGGRSAYWQESTGTVVIRNPRAADGGTAFQPVDGRAYFDGLR